MSEDLELREKVDKLLDEMQAKGIMCVIAYASEEFLAYRSNSTEELAVEFILTSVIKKIKTTWPGKEI